MMFVRVVMNANQFNTALRTLTKLETEALYAAFKSSQGNGHDFGFSDEVIVPNQSKQANGALVSNLLKKKIIRIDYEFGQIEFAGVEYSPDGSEMTKYDAAEIVDKFLTEAGFDTAR